MLLAWTEAIALIGRLASNLASPVNLTSLAEDVGLRDNQRATDRMNGLAENFLGWRCYREDDGVPAPKAQRKFYFMDPVLARLASIRNPSYREPDDAKITEQQIGLALHRATAISDPALFIAAQTVMYQRKRSGDEIDFVGPTLGGPFEGKYVDVGWKPQTKGMLSRYGRGIMATRTAFDLSGPVKAIPASIIAWLLGSREPDS